MYVQIQIIGNIARDPKKNEYASSKKTSTSIAYSTGYGEKKKTHFLDVDGWGTKADILESYAVKGTRVLLTGELEQQEWEDKATGSKRSKHVMVVRDIVLLSPKDKTPQQPDEFESSTTGLDLSKFKLPF